MGDFDSALKELFQSEAAGLAQRFGGAPLEEWLNVELPATRERRVDLVARLKNGEILHVEFQSSNDVEMPWRQLEYYVLLRRRYGRSPRQVLLYIGAEPMRIAASLSEPRLEYSYAAVDARQLNAEELLASSAVAENILAILADTADPESLARRILQRIQPLEPERRERALRLLLILSIQRNLVGIVKQEARTMGVVIDPLQDSYLRGLYEQARTAGEAQLLRRQLQSRFGELPAWAEERLQAASESDLDTWAVRVLSEITLESVFQKPA